MKGKLKKLYGSIRAWWLLRNVLTEQTVFGANVAIWDHLSPEENAVVQSLNSRSAGGFIKNLRKMCLEGFKKVMRVFYSGYGHKSIADCGSTNAAFDNVSMLTAKGWQDWQLYNGQETSTRYIDVTGLGYVDPIATDESRRIMKRWFDFYNQSIAPTIEFIKQVRPKKEGEDAKKWETAIEKRVYDILGCFLPAGTRTNLSCHMTLRQWDDKLSYMIHHPIDEIRESAIAVRSLLQKRYPSTFLKKKTYQESENFRKEYMHEYYYIPQEDDFTQDIYRTEKSYGGLELYQNFQHDVIISRYRNLLETRPSKTEVPKALNEAGNYRMQFIIDFRSFRDLQRQRSALQRHPLLTMEFGFEEWYLSQLPPDVREAAVLLIEEQKKAIMKLTDDPLVRQYYIPMGFKVYTAFTIGLADMVYIIELRTPGTVHPTARIIAKKAHEQLKRMLPDWFTIYADNSEDTLSIKRADHDLFIGTKRFSEI